MVSAQIYALFTILLACLLCTSSGYTLVSSVPCPRHAIRNCMSKVPNIGSPTYCKEAVAAIACAVGVVQICPDDQQMLADMVAYNPLGLSHQLNRICRTAVN